MVTCVIVSSYLTGFEQLPELGILPSYHDRIAVLSQWRRESFSWTKNVKQACQVAWPLLRDQTSESPKDDHQ